MDPRLLEILVCPVCKGPLDFRKANQELVCKACKLAFPVRDDIPVRKCVPPSSGMVLPP